MNKLILSSIIILFISHILLSSAVFALDSGTEIILGMNQNKALVSGIEKAIDSNKNVYPVVSNNRCLVPLRFLSEHLNWNVSWDSLSKCITITKDDLIIQFTIDNKTFFINGAQQVLDVPPSIIEGRTFVPTRAISNCMGLQVFWNDGIVAILSSETPIDPAQWPLWVKLLSDINIIPTEPLSTPAITPVDPLPTPTITPAENLQTPTITPTEPLPTIDTQVYPRKLNWTSIATKAITLEKISCTNLANGQTTTLAAGTKLVIDGIAKGLNLLRINIDREKYSILQQKVFLYKTDLDLKMFEAIKTGAELSVTDFIAKNSSLLKAYKKNFIVILFKETYQLVILDKNLKILNQYTVSHGRENSVDPEKSKETPEGCFTIYDKVACWDFNTYKVYNVAKFFDGYALHSITMHDGKVFDGTMGKKISSGCIRQPLEKSKWLYQLIPIGSPFIVF